MVRKFCSCFVILLWQRILSEDPHKLEEPSPPAPHPTTNSTLIIGKGQDTAVRQLLDLWTGEHQDHNFTAFVSLKWRWNPSTAIRFTAPPESMGWFQAVCSCFWLWNATRAYFLWSAQKLFLSFLCASKFLFIPLAFHFCLLFCLGSWDCNETDLQEWAAVEALAGVNSISWAWIGDGGRWLGRAQGDEATTQQCR